MNSFKKLNAKERIHEYVDDTNAFILKPPVFNSFACGLRLHSDEKISSQKSVCSCKLIAEVIFFVVQLERTRPLPTFPNCDKYPCSLKPLHTNSLL